MDALRPGSALLDAPASGRVGPYRLLGELGRGGMGVVYRAEDTRLGRLVALKCLPAALAHDARAKERLMLEARAAAALDHPNVCTVYEVAETDAGQPYIALACYDGETLADRLAGGALPVGEAERIGGEIAAGVAAAHARGVVHRDLKPSNVFLTQDGTVKVLDFGVAEVAGVALHQTGRTAGTVEYGAPEQAHGRADARSDVWALGVVLYEMLTGRHPFVAPYHAAVLYAVLHEQPPPPSALNPDVPPELDAVVAQCLAKDPEDRYPDAAALGAALAPADTPPSGDLLTALRRSRRRLGLRLRRSRAWQAGAVAVLVALVALGAGLLRSGGGAPGMPEAIHLAVLPLSPRPDGPDDRAFAEGLAETLASGVTELAGAGSDLWVAPTADVEALGVTSAREAGAALGVNLALTGSFQREPGRLTLTLNLSTAGDRPRTLASRTLTLSTSEESRVRGRALLAIAEMLGLAVSDADDARLAIGTADPEAQRYYLAGVGYLERNREAEDLDRAIDLFEQAIAEDPAFVAAHARLGAAFLATYRATRDSVWIGRTQAAVARAQSLDADDAATHVTLSGLAEATGRYPLAMHHARQALALDPALLTAYLALADAQEASADVEGAEATLRRYLRQRPEAWPGLLALGQFLFRQQRFGEAASAFERVVALAPGHYRGLLGLGGARHAGGDAAGARRAYERVLALRPDHYAAHLNLATLALTEGDARGAARRYRQALALDSTDHLTWRNLASAYSMTGETARRREALEGALRRAALDLSVNPNDAQTLADVAVYHQGLGHRAAALGAARRAVTLAPGDPTVQYDAARVFALLGEPLAALAALEASGAAGRSLDGAAADPAFADLARLPQFPGSP